MPNKKTLIQLNNATLKRGDRVLWDKLNLSVNSGELLAILGPNGAGKTSLLKVILGQLKLSSGEINVLDSKVKKNNDLIGYIPQLRNFDIDLPLRGRDLVEFGLNGNKFGLHLRDSSQRTLVNMIIDQVDADKYSNKLLNKLSGGEQQRLRIAQALISKPRILLCDEPLLSLDIASQAKITELIDNFRKDKRGCVLFVTHEINPILKIVDNLLYLANGKWILDKPSNVLNSSALSKLYGTNVQVIRHSDRLFVVGAEDINSGQAGHHEVVD